MCVCVCARARCAIFSHVWLFAAPWTGDCQAPLSMGLSRQEYGVSCCALLQGLSPTQGSNPCLASPALGGKFFTTEPPGKPFTCYVTGLLSVTQEQPGERYAQGKAWAEGRKCHSLQISSPPTWKLSEPSHLEFDGVILDIWLIKPLVTGNPFNFSPSPLPRGQGISSKNSSTLITWLVLPATSPLSLHTVQ